MRHFRLITNVKTPCEFFNFRIGLRKTCVLSQMFRPAFSLKKARRDRFEGSRISDQKVAPSRRRIFLKFCAARRNSSALSGGIMYSNMTVALLFPVSSSPAGSGSILWCVGDKSIFSAGSLKRKAKKDARDNRHSGGNKAYS